MGRFSTKGFTKDIEHYKRVISEDSGIRPFLSIVLMLLT